MCGIAGFVSDNLNYLSLRSMISCLNHRGPDADGIYHEGPVGLGHKRLSIIDLSDKANQPMFSEDHDMVIVFNGEIYNYAEIRKDLSDLGYSFKTNSDTEVILQAFRAWEGKAIERFIGMFVFALYKRSNQTLYLYRDRVGVKPLFYYHKGNEFWFASELKSIANQLEQKNINSLAVSDFFRFGYIRYPHTIFSDVYKLPPGHFAIVKNGKLNIQPYWQIESVKPGSFSGSEDKALGELESLMKSSFDYRMVADVPVGLFLSGGIDSSSLSALLSAKHKNLKTFSIGFDEERYNEAVYAKTIATYLGTDHHEQILSSSDAEKVLDKYFEIFDEPFADSSGIPVYLVSEFAKQHGCKVVLSADGGDELFGGYDRYSSIPLLKRRLSKMKAFTGILSPALQVAGNLPLEKFNVKHRSAKLNDLLNNYENGKETAFYTSWLSIVSDKKFNILTGSHHTTEPELNAPSFEEQMMLWDFKYYLPEDLLTKVDRATMATSIEAREPFLDHRLIEFVFSLPLHYRMKQGQSKYLLKKILYKYIPQSYFDRKKMGFSIPLFKWFSQKLDAEFEHLFTIEKLNDIPVLNTTAVIDEYKKYLFFKSIGKEYNMLLIWHLYVFLKWWQKWMVKN